MAHACFLRLALGLALSACGIGYATAVEESPSVAPIPDDVWQAMRGKSWHEDFGCPAREALVLVSAPYLDFDGKSRTGKLIVAKELGPEVFKNIFEEIHATGALRIARMDLIDVFDGDDGKSMAANNTSAFNCRKVTGGTKLSSHSFGTAIDINPVQNPYVKKKVMEPNPEGLPFDTAPERAAALKDKTAGVIGRTSAAVKIFAKHDWTWGGSWKTLKDYQHFSKDGK